MEELEKAVRGSVLEGLKEFKKLKQEGVDDERAYMTAQTKSIKKFYDDYIRLIN